MGIGPNSRAAFQVFLKTRLSEGAPDFGGKGDLLAVYPRLRFSPTVETSLWAVIIILLKVPTAEIGQFMRDWKNSNAMTSQVEKIVAFFDLVSAVSPSNYELFEAGKETLLNTIDVAHILGQPVDAKALVDRYMALPIKSADELAVDGRFLIQAGIKHGPGLGRLLAIIKERVLAGQLGNTEDGIG
ncbi:CCA tRNA nucleotidyltransferase, partial [Lactobacillus sp. XV13L]|nr:CCA tRNA nucleotidyltransferase [Lactobacillus sp. XV13L]